jgi:DNA-binding SARP family transcriptional activator
MLGTSNRSGKAAQTEADSPWLEIETFGCFRVRRKGTPLKAQAFGRRQAWELLKMLVAYRGQPLSFEEIIEQLWPDADPELGKRRLYVVMNALRKELEPDPNRPTVILTEGETYRFAPKEACFLDVERFEGFIQEGNRLDGLAAVAAYGKALALYKGAFLAEETYSAWCELERSYLREMAIRALERTAEILVRLDHASEAVSAYWRLIHLDPWHEAAYIALIRLLTVLRQPMEARKAFDLYSYHMKGEGLPISSQVVELLHMTGSVKENP